jgi:hypothetical protein
MANLMMNMATSLPRVRHRSGDPAFQKMADLISASGSALPRFVVAHIIYKRSNNE